MDTAAARGLFDANAETYDRVNTIISLGLDARWRDWTAGAAVARPGTRLLDAFAGTGLVGLRAAALRADVTLADVSPHMLEVARRRAEKRGLAVRFVEADLSVAGVSVVGAPFDAITMVFGVRYLDDPVGVLRGLSRLLVRDGRFVIVEFVEPSARLLSRLAGFYFSHVLPTIASVVAGRTELYSALTSTTHAMGSAEHLVSIVEKAGLEMVERHMMGFDLVCGIVARMRREDCREDQKEEQT